MDSHRARSIGRLDAVDKARLSLNDRVRWCRVDGFFAEAVSPGTKAANNQAGPGDRARAIISTKRPRFPELGIVFQEKARTPELFSPKGAASSAHGEPASRTHNSAPLQSLARVELEYIPCNIVGPGRSASLIQFPNAGS